MEGSESNGEKSSAQKGSMTRRVFLKGAGLTAAGAAVIEGGLLGVKEAAAAAAAEPLVVGPGRVPLTLKVNGVAKRLEIEPRTTLAEALRFELGLTGTKVVCD